MSGKVLRLVRGREERIKALRERLISCVESMLEEDPKFPAEVQAFVVLGFYADGRSFIAGDKADIPGLWSRERIIVEAQERVRTAMFR